MKSRKGLLLLAIVLFGGLFFAFKSFSTGGTDLLITQRQRLLSAVGSILEDLHYSPKIINDAFSKQVFKKYLDELDGDKSMFLLSDISGFKKYETTLDDEIHGAPIEFVPAVSTIYDQRMAEVIVLYKEILATPVNFTKDETGELEGEKIAYVSTEAARKERWRKKLKGYTLERYVDLQDQREKNKGTKDFVVKTDTELEKDAREKVLKIMNESFERIKRTFKEDERFNSYINVITNQMDPHSDYFPPVEKRSFDERM